MGVYRGLMHQELGSYSIRRHPSLADQVYEALTDSISIGRLQPGQRLVLDRLAEQLGVSQTPIREALARLLQDGVIEEGLHGKLRMISITPRYVSDAFLVRASLEGVAAELAASRMTDVQIAELRAMLAHAADALASDVFGPHISVDNRLHSAVCETAGNVLLARELKSLQLHIDFIRGYSQRHSGDHIRRSHEEHVALLDALTRRDPSAARTAMELHIHLSGERISRLLDFNDETDLEFDHAIRGAKRASSS